MPGSQSHRPRESHWNRCGADDATRRIAGRSGPEERSRTQNARCGFIAPPTHTCSSGAVHAAHETDGAGGYQAQPCCAHGRDASHALNMKGTRPVRKLTANCRQHLIHGWNASAPLALGRFRQRASDVTTAMRQPSGINGLNRHEFPHRNRRAVQSRLRLRFAGMVEGGATQGVTKSTGGGYGSAPPFPTPTNMAIRPEPTPA